MIFLDFNHHSATWYFDRKHGDLESARSLDAGFVNVNGTYITGCAHYQRFKGQVRPHGIDDPKNYNPALSRAGANLPRPEGVRITEGWKQIVQALAERVFSDVPEIVLRGAVYHAGLTVGRLEDEHKKILANLGTAETALHDARTKKALAEVALAEFERTSGE